MKKEYDVCAIGNALVDYEIEVENDFLAANQVEKGLMTLVDQDRQAELLSLAHGKIKKRQGGGSAANTIFGLTAFGGKGFYTCKVANDQDGSLYINDLLRAGIDTNLDVKNLSEGTTGKCLVMITPDAERTMNTFLGVTADFSPSELDLSSIEKSKFIFMEGFLVSSPSGLEAMKLAKKHAVENGVKVGLTFSDPAMVKYFNDQMKEIVGDGVDLLFCNIEEAELFTDTNELNEAKMALKKIARQFVITLSEKGALVYDGERFIEIQPFPTTAVDSTGAGDMFAGAFLYAINNGYDFKSAGMLASAASSAVVSKFGPRLEEGQIEKILSQI